MMRRRLARLARAYSPDGARTRARVIRYRTVAAFLADYDASLRQDAVFLNTRHPDQAGARVQLVLALQRPAFRTGIEGRVARVSRVGNASNEVPGMSVDILRGGKRLAGLAKALYSRLSHIGRGAATRRPVRAV
jgi:Tfp pilus assembly protein PilZ